MIAVLFFLTFASYVSTVTISGTGSTLAQPLYSEWTFAYKLLKPDIEIDYTPTGSGAGQTAIKAYQVDFAGSDSALKAADYVAEPDLQMFPSVASAVVLNYNLPLPTGTTLVLDLDCAVGIFSGNITMWNDSAILDLNPDLGPYLNSSITVVVRSDSSGTTDILTHALQSASSAWKSDFSTFTSWPASLLKNSNFRAASGSYGVFAEVEATSHSVGYLSLSYLVASNSPYAYMKNLEGNVVPADAAYVEEAISQAVFNDYFNADITNLPGMSWPISGFTYFIIHTKNNTNCDVRREMFKWFHWIFSDSVAIARAENQGYAPLSANVREQVLALLGKVECDGTPLLSTTFVPPISKATSKAFIAIACILIAYCLFWVALLFAFRNSRMFKATGMYFVAFSLTGAVLNYIGIILWSLEPNTDGICISRVWFVTVGYAMLLGAMLTKVYEVRCIFRDMEHDFKRLIGLVTKVKTVRFVRTFGIIIGLQLLLLVLWTAIDPYKAVQRVDDNLDLLSSWHCECNREVIGWSFEISYFGILLIWGFWLAYKTKNVKANYNESRSIMFSIYNLVVCIAIFAPFISSAGSDSSFYSAIFVGVMFPTTFIISIIYLQKFKVLWVRLQTKVSDRSASGAEKSDTQSSGARRIYLPENIANKEEFDFGNVKIEAVKEMDKKERRENITKLIEHKKLNRE